MQNPIFILGMLPNTNSFSNYCSIEFDYELKLTYERHVKNIGEFIIHVFHYSLTNLKFYFSFIRGKEYRL